MTVRELINEALVEGVNVYDHVAIAKYGSCDEASRTKAKELIYFTMCKVVPELWDSSQWRGLNWTPTDKQIEDNADRVRRFTIKVLNDTEPLQLYSVLATSEIDARVMAFILDGGFSDKFVDNGLIELAKAWTEVCE
jgi:hypothetical protein